MAGYILSDGVSYPKSLAYAALFTGIHLADIVIVTLLAKFAFHNFDSSAYFSEIQKYSSITLVLVALVFLSKSVWNFWKKPEKNTNAKAT